jgi:hypothetical protein
MSPTKMVVALLVLFSAAIARAELVSARWGDEGRVAHPRTLRVLSSPAGARLVFDLSALPRDAKVYHARLYASCSGGQPREPAEIYVTQSLADRGGAVYSGKPLQLAPPWYAYFAATEAVRLWVAQPEKNLGFAVARFDGMHADRSMLEISYEGTAPKALPPQVDQLRVIHHDGQTFLTFRELPIFRPAPEKIYWIDDYADADKCIAREPGMGKAGHPRIPGIRLDTLRVDLQGLEVRTRKGPGQSMVPFQRIRELPDVCYRVYRSDKAITSETLTDALLVGEAAPLGAYDESMIRIQSYGEYYNPHELIDNIIGTFCVADHQGVLPGHALYVHTPDKAGRAYYAVTAMENGAENTAISKANSTAQPVAEEVHAPMPLKYYTVSDRYRTQRGSPTTYHFLIYLAPPLANLPEARPHRIGVSVADDYKAPGPLLLNFGRASPEPGAVMLAMEPAGDLCYNDGRGTLKSFRQSKLDYYPERYFFHIVNWAKARWEVDAALISSIRGMSLHLAIRHPEIFGVIIPDAPNCFQNDFDQKWNPACLAMTARVGPADIVKTPDGKAPGWSLFDISWYLKEDPGKDIPFICSLGPSGKDTGHSAEYGWQDDPKGYAALRDARQPFVANWGCGISPKLREMLLKMRWDKSVPAFSRCSLDNNPGNGDADDGDVIGQINGYLMWDKVLACCAPLWRDSRNSRKARPGPSWRSSGCWLSARSWSWPWCWRGSGRTAGFRPRPGISSAACGPRSRPAGTRRSARRARRPRPPWPRSLPIWANPRRPGSGRNRPSCSCASRSTGAGRG